MTPHDPAEVDRRFQELMRAEFADEASWTGASAPAEPAAAEPAVVQRVLPFSAGRVDDDAFDLHGPDDLSYRQVGDDLRPWSATSLVGFLLMGGGLAGMLAMIFGVTLGAPWAQLALTATVGGLTVLLVQALRAPARDGDDDGARL